MDTLYLQIKLLSENKLKLCAFVNLHYQISRQKLFEPESELEVQVRVPVQVQIFLLKSVSLYI